MQAGKKELRVIKGADHELTPEYIEEVVRRL